MTESADQHGLGEIQGDHSFTPGFIQGGLEITRLWQTGRAALAGPEVLQQDEVLQRDASVRGERDAQPSGGRKRARGSQGF